MTTRDVRELRALSAELRLHVVRMMGPDKAHHFGAPCRRPTSSRRSIYRMRYDPQNPAWPGRDRFIMSKGHCVPAQYAALGMLGVLPIEELGTLKQLGSRLQGHPAMHLTPGIEGCTGSLGQGLSYANGLALAGRLQGLDYSVYCLIGDGETQEGQVWEAAATSSSSAWAMSPPSWTERAQGHGRDVCGKTMEPQADRWRACGWRARRSTAATWPTSSKRWIGPRGPRRHPRCSSPTRSGQGDLFIEHRAAFHNAALTPSRSQALREIKEA